MISLIEKYCSSRQLLILGFGREGRSTLNFLMVRCPDIRVGIADRNLTIRDDIPQGIAAENLYLGDDYFRAIHDYNVIFKSPGVRLPQEIAKSGNKIWLSQTGLFLERYRNQIIGITGTKGKSTTASLTCHLLVSSGKNAVLVGNIGLPPFDLMDEIGGETLIVFELSANQLEYTKHSPWIAVLLNLFPEHLDHFGNPENYYRAKSNIIRYQSGNDFLIFDDQNPNLKKLLKSDNFLPQKFPIGKPGGLFNEEFLNRILQNKTLEGRHNEKNCVAAAMACKLSGADADGLVAGMKTFKPLKHRLEYAGTYCGIRFYNDSISTIPESTIEALKTISNTGTLILGGFDRGLDYGELYRFVAASSVDLVVFTGPAGRRMMSEFSGINAGKQEVGYVSQFRDLPAWMRKTPAGRSCLLSPAASSYDAFQNFEERGWAFKKMAETLGGSCQ